MTSRPSPWRRIGLGAFGDDLLEAGPGAAADEDRVDVRRRRVAAVPEDVVVAASVLSVSMTCASCPLAVP
jgi:hypothetical protein